jgi:hypothetical protein
MKLVCKVGAAVTAALVVATSILPQAHAAPADEFLGQWYRMHSPARQMVIERNGANYVLRETGIDKGFGPVLTMTMPAEYSAEMLRVASGPQGIVTFAVDRKTGRLVSMYGEYTRSKEEASTPLVRPEQRKQLPRHW